MHIEQISVQILRPHEETVEEHVLLLQREIRLSGVVKEPLLVDSLTGIVLDGHHRLKAAQRCGLSTVPCLSIDYMNSDNMVVDSWQAGRPISKEEVILAGISGCLLPPKTSRHTLSSREVRYSVA